MKEPTISLEEVQRMINENLKECEAAYVLAVDTKEGLALSAGRQTYEQSMRAVGGLLAYLLAEGEAWEWLDMLSIVFESMHEAVKDYNEAEVQQMELPLEFDA